jgi:hypothetical protein
MEREFVGILTAEEFINDIRNATYSEEEKLIIFARLHVEAALKKASEGQINKDIYMMLEYGEDMNWKSSILNSYPLENIK